MNQQEWTISTRRTGLIAYVRDTFEHRKLFRFFCVRQLQRIYRNTLLGKLWIFIRPIVTIALYTIFFGAVIRVDMPAIPFLLYMILGFTVWNTFEKALTWSTRSLSSARSLIRKIYFPRLMLPISAQIVSVVECLFFVIYMIGAFTYYNHRGHEGLIQFKLELLAAPLIIFLTLFFALALSLWTTVIDTLGRDFRFTLRYILQGWLYCTPVFYLPQSVPTSLKWLSDANPLTHLVINFRAAILATESVHWEALIYPSLLSFGLFVIGLWFFLSFESRSVDSI